MQIFSGLISIQGNVSKKKKYNDMNIYIKALPAIHNNNNNNNNRVNLL